MDLTEAERQVLATLARAARDGTGGDRAALERDGTRFWQFKEDWSETLSALAAKGLVTGTDAGYALTGAGRPLAEQADRDRPDRYAYYYRKLYPAALASAAHSRFCERVYGRDLCQEGQVAMAELDEMLACLDLQPDDRVLDVGCGAGGIAEYIAGRTGAAVTGLEFATGAVAAARMRFKDAPRLRFVEGDMHAPAFGPGSFEAVLSIDSLYGARDLETVLAGLAGLLAPSGQLAVFFSQEWAGTPPPAGQRRHRTDVALALRAAGLDYTVFNYTRQAKAFWSRLDAAVHELRPAYEAEGNGFIAESLIEEAERHLPAIAEGRLTRFLYLVRI